MAKRSKDTLTGGTGDVNPQYASIGVFTPAIPGGGSASAVAPIVLPVLPNLGGTQDTAQVVELLKVVWDAGGQPQVTTPPQLYSTTSVRLAFNSVTAGSAVTSTSIQGTIANPLIIDEVSVVQQSLQEVAAAGGSYAFAFQTAHNLQTDLTDGAGHGILVAVPTIWFGVSVSGWPAGGVAFGAARVFYRLKRVKLIEYIGIVQQQSGPQI